MIILVRHTRVAVPPGMIYGHSDVALADSFEAEADVVFDHLITQLHKTHHVKSPGCVRLHSSPLSRCLRLARHIETRLADAGSALAVTECTINVDLRLMEMNFGDWETMTWADISRIGGKSWGDNWETQATPHGESFPQLFDRAVAFYDALLAMRESADRPWVDIVVSHAGIIRCLYAHANDLARREAFSLSPDFGSVHLLQPPST